VDFESFWIDKFNSSHRFNGQIAAERFRKRLFWANGSVKRIDFKWNDYSIKNKHDNIDLEIKLAISIKYSIAYCLLSIIITKQLSARAY
jgi:hypothetical protein